MRSDVDVANQLIHVRRTAYMGKLQTPKTGRVVRSFLISKNLVAVLAQRLSGTVLSGTVLDDLLFPNPNDRLYIAGEVCRHFLKPILVKLGIDSHRKAMHAFRHGNISAMAILHTPMKVQMDRVGHASSWTTMGYTYAASADHRIAADVLGAMFDSSEKEVGCKRK